MKFRLIETYLFEDIAAVKKQYSYIPEEDFDKIIRLDPTFDENRDSVGKYGKWLLGLYKKDNPLNTPGATTFLQMYDEIKNDNSKKIEKDIGKFKSFRELYDAISNAEDVELSDRQKLRKKQANKDYDLVWQNDNWAIFVPNTWEADVNLGKGTTWCTADSREESGKKYYDQYLREGGKYYVIINKHDKEEKYQFHFESKQFMDKDDSPIDVAEFVDADSANGMRTFFEKEGYEVDDYAITEFEDWDAVIDGLFDQPGEEVSIGASVDVLGVLFGTDEDWNSIFSIIDALNGYYTIEDIYETLLYPYSNTVISTLQDTFNDYDFQLPDELEDDWDSQEDFLMEFSKIINDYITDYYLEDLTGTNYPQSYFKVEDNNLTISMDRNVLRNEIIDFYATVYPELLLEYESAEDVIYDLTQAAESDFRGVSDEEAVLLMFIGTDNLKCEIDPSELISNLVYYITAGHAKEIISKLKNYFNHEKANEIDPRDILSYRLPTFKEMSKLRNNISEIVWLKNTPEDFNKDDLDEYGQLLAVIGNRKLYSLTRVTNRATLALVLRINHLASHNLETSDKCYIKGQNYECRVLDQNNIILITDKYTSFDVNGKTNDYDKSSLRYEVDEFMKNIRGK